jgi:hypothetical protein
VRIEIEYIIRAHANTECMISKRLFIISLASCTLFGAELDLLNVVSFISQVRGPKMSSYF